MNSPQNPIKVLIIDDEPHIREGIVDFLEDNEFEPFAAENGAVGLEKISSEKPDLVLCDLRMPEVDGFEVIRQTTEKYPLLPIIAISGTNEISDAVESIRLGAWDYILKPIVDFSFLNLVMERALERAELKRKDLEYKEILEAEVEARTSELKRINESLLQNLNKRIGAEKQLRTNEQLFRKVINNVPQLIYVIDKSGRIILANKSILTFLENETQTILGSTLAEMAETTGLNDIFNPDYLEILDSNNARLISNQIVDRKTVEPRIINTLLIPLQTNTTDKLLLSVSDDITERITAERRHAEASEIVERTAKAASIGVIAGGVTHEVAQPLNGIILNTETLQVLLNNEEIEKKTHVQQLIGDITTGARRINEIVQHMRSLWVSPLGKKLEIVDLNQCVYNSLDIIGRQLRNHFIKVVADLQDTPVIIKGDSIHVEQIILNFLSNSMHAFDKQNERNNREIIVRTSEEKDTAILEVSDNGPGLPDVDQEVLFDPFYSSRKEEQGTGLGLAVVRAFVNRYNGELEATNNPDRGANFRVIFPFSSESSGKD